VQFHPLSNARERMNQLMTLNNHNLRWMTRSLFYLSLLCYVTWPEEDWEEQQDLSWFTDQVCQSTWYIPRNKATEHEGHACYSHCNRPGKYSYNKRKISKGNYCLNTQPKTRLFVCYLYAAVVRFRPRANIESKFHSPLCT